MGFPALQNHSGGEKCPCLPWPGLRPPAVTLITTSADLGDNLFVALQHLPRMGGAMRVLVCLLPLLLPGIGAIGLRRPGPPKSPTSSFLATSASKDAAISNRAAIDRSGQQPRPVAADQLYHPYNNVPAGRKPVPGSFCAGRDSKGLLPLSRRYRRPVSKANHLFSPTQPQR